MDGWVGDKSVLRTDDCNQNCLINNIDFTFWKIIWLKICKTEQVASKKIKYAEHRKKKFVVHLLVFFLKPVQFQLLPPPHSFGSQRQLEAIQVCKMCSLTMSHGHLGLMSLSQSWVQKNLKRHLNLKPWQSVEFGKFAFPLYLLQAVQGLHLKRQLHLPSFILTTLD